MDFTKEYKKCYGIMAVKDGYHMGLRKVWVIGSSDLKAIISNSKASLIFKKDGQNGETWNPI